GSGAALISGAIPERLGGSARNGPRRPFPRSAAPTTDQHGASHPGGRPRRAAALARVWLPNSLASGPLDGRRAAAWSRAGGRGPRSLGALLGRRPGGNSFGGGRNGPGGPPRQRRVARAFPDPQ